MHRIYIREIYQSYYKAKVHIHATIIRSATQLQKDRLDPTSGVISSRRFSSWAWMHCFSTSFASGSFAVPSAFMMIHRLNGSFWLQESSSEAQIDLVGLIKSFRSTWLHQPVANPLHHPFNTSRAADKAVNLVFELATPLCTFVLLGSFIPYSVTQFPEKIGWTSKAGSTPKHYYFPLATYLAEF